VRAEGTATTLRRCAVLSSAPRDARWPIATHHPFVPSPLFPSVTPFPSSLLSAARLRPGATDATLAVVAVHGLAVGARPSSASQLVPSALVRPAADLPSDALGQPRQPVNLCPRRLAAATSAAPRRFPSPLRLDVTSPSALLKPRVTAAATSSRELTSRLPAISACRASSCHSASSCWRPASPHWVSLSRKQRTSSVDGQCHWRPLGRPCETAGAPERPWAIARALAVRAAAFPLRPPASALPGPFVAAPAALPPTPVPRGQWHLALCDKTKCVTSPGDSLASSDSESAGGAPVTKPVCLH